MVVYVVASMIHGHTNIKYIDCVEDSLFLTLDAAQTVTYQSKSVMHMNFDSSLLILTSCRQNVTKDQTKDWGTFQT